IAWGCSPPDSSRSSATATNSTPAFPAHARLKPVRLSKIVANSGVPRRVTMNRHGCALFADGDHRAASNIAVRSDSDTVAVESKARGLHRFASAGSSGSDVSAVRGIAVDTDLLTVACSDNLLAPRVMQPVVTPFIPMRGEVSCPKEFVAWRAPISLRCLAHLRVCAIHRR